MRIRDEVIKARQQKAYQKWLEEHRNWVHQPEKEQQIEDAWWEYRDEDRYYAKLNVQRKFCPFCGNRYSGEECGRCGMS